MKPNKENYFLKYYRRIKRTYKFIKDNRIIDDPVETPLGFRLIGHREMERGVFEPEETLLITNLLKKAEVFINIGANIGYYCCIALRDGKHTVAFEPIDTNLRYLYRNIRANSFEKNLEVFPVALSNATGLMEMFGSGTGASLIKGWANTPEYQVSVVPTSTLDTVLGTRFCDQQCLILVDVEGAEKAMLQGSSTFLRSDPKPVWLVEISTTEHQPKGVRVNPDLVETFQLFWKNGYDAWTGNAQPRLITAKEVEMVANGGENTFPTNNFLFIEEGKKGNFLP